MKKEKGTRCTHLHTVGPSLILKTVKPEDSFARFAAIHDTNWQWQEQLREFRTDALDREDPFRAQEFYLPYSLNKRRRWVVPDIVGDEIESDPALSLRVSASVHLLSRNDILPIWQPSPWGIKHGITMVERLPTEEYHDVRQDGRARHRVRKHAQLITLDRDEKTRGTIHDDIAARSSLPYDKERMFQKAHVRYNVIRMVDDRRKVHRYNKPRYNHWGTYDTTIRDRHKQRNDHGALLQQELRELWHLGCSCCTNGDIASDPHCTAAISTKEAKQLLSSESFSVFQSVVRESHLRKGKARRCPQCRWPIDYGGGMRGDSCSCGALLCSHCPGLFHFPLPCDRAAQYNAHGPDPRRFPVGGCCDGAGALPELRHVYMQRSVGCDHMQCVCGASFCFRCGSERNERHVEGKCRQQTLETMVLMDVFTRSGATVFPRKIIEQALGRRAQLAMRRAEIVSELSVLSRSTAKMYMRKIAVICTLLESAILGCSRTSAVARIDMAICRFLNNANRISSSNKRGAMARRADDLIAECFH